MSSERRTSPLPRASATAALEQGIGYCFADRALLVQALTHRSASGPHNERLEFLGDAVLGWVAAELLYERFPAMSEGALTRARAVLVRKSSLARLARELDLGAYLTLGAGELRTGGRERDALLADALEALIGAIHLDGGVSAARDCVRRLLLPPLARLDAERSQKDAKTRLQEYLQGRGLPLPSYPVDAVHGLAHARSFDVSCLVEALQIRASATGSSRQQAELRAAELVLRELEGGD